MSVEILPPPIMLDDDICDPDSPHAPAVLKSDDDLRGVDDGTAQEDVPRGCDDEMLGGIEEDSLPMLEVSPSPTKNKSMISALAPEDMDAVSLHDEDVIIYGNPDGALQRTKSPKSQPLPDPVEMEPVPDEGGPVSGNHRMSFLCVVVVLSSA